MATNSHMWKTMPSGAMPHEAFCLWITASHFLGCVEHNKDSIKFCYVKELIGKLFLYVCPSLVEHWVLGLKYFNLAVLYVFLCSISHYDKWISDDSYFFLFVEIHFPSGNMRLLSLSLKLRNMRLLSLSLKLWNSEILLYYVFFFFFSLNFLKSRECTLKTQVFFLAAESSFL
jgi:hypothetical protein